MTVRIYASTDASAPTLTGAAGSLTTLLDAILVNGYGSKTAAGWTINQTTTNKRGYKQNTTGANNSSGMLLYVDDTAPGAGGAREARVCGFETMSAITPTGTGQFPTAAQSSVGVGTLVVRKSTTADATTRPWYCIANGQNVYLFMETGDITTPTVAACSLIFGDFVSYKSGGDQYAVCIIGRVAENQSSAQYDPLQLIPPEQWSATRVTPLQQTYMGHFMARTFTGTGGSKKFAKTIDMGKIAESTYANQGTNAFTGGYSGEAQTTVVACGSAIGYNYMNVFPYPNAIDNSLHLSRIEITHDGGTHGYLKGLWAPLHHRPLGHGDTYTVSSGDLNGKSMISMAIPVYGNAINDCGQIHVETSDTWS